MDQSAYSRFGRANHARRRLNLCLRPTPVYLPLLLALLAIAFVTSVDARAVSYDSRDTRDLASDEATVAVPRADNFVVGSIRGQPPTTRHFNFVVSQMNGSPDGFSKPMLVVNGLFPGPTIEANQGDRIVVHVTNTLSTRTTIHWHGLYQNGTNYYDGTAGVTECGIPPGQSLTYNFTVDDFSGTTWWHAHYDTQYTDGVTGALIVHPRKYPRGFPTWDEDIVVELTDIYHAFSATILSEYLGGGGGPLTGLQLETPDSGAINGIGQYNGSTKYTNLNLKPNKTYRLRLIHTGSAAAIRFSVDYHALTVIEADSTLTQPYTVSSVTLAVAQRYSVLLTTNQPAEPARNYWMRAALKSAVAVPGANADIRGILRYGSGHAAPTAGADPGVPGSGLADLDVAKLVPAAPRTPPPATKAYTVDFSIGGKPDGGAFATMNGTSWQPLQGTTTLLQIVDAARNGSMYAPEGSSIQPGSQFLITEDSVEVVDILLVNTGPGDHPFHLHGHTPYIMGFGTGTYTGTGLNTVNPFMRDTFAVPGSGWLLMRIVTDNPGIWTLHCHIAWHMAAGLMMQISSLPSKAAQLDIPRDIVRQCSA
uniref:laccase n=1 Tax=Phanerodontia chrysosporium TaxID=2822231 RepID=Q6QNN1_PHACH|nr:multicopper oxidase 4B [Phanerodontia chrysosporium]